MGQDDLGEEMALRAQDRGGNRPLTRGPDPDKVAKHLATGEGETLIAAKAADGFKTESPIRAFTDFQVAGSYAIGKGFRPSLAHLARYLDAMEEKEGWRLVQVILPETDAGDPTILFHRTRPLLLTNRVYPDGGSARGTTPKKHRKHDEENDFGVEHEKPHLVEDDRGMQQVAYYSAGTWWQGHNDSGPDVQTERPIVRLVDRPVGETYGVTEIRVDGVPVPTYSATYKLDDPLNPKHYAGRACADIGERLSANGYQVLKYCWRLGKKDDPCVELGKALWYLKSEFDLVQMLPEGLVSKPMLVGIADPQAFLEERIADQPDFTQNIARMLWAGYDLRGIFPMRVAIEEHRVHLDCGRGLAI